LVQKGVFPGLWSGFERRLAKRKPVVFDLDDAIWLPRKGGNPLLRALHRESAVQDILRSSAAVIAGNEFLADYARRFNPHVTVVPSCLDTARYPRGTSEPRIGWIGSSTTLPYLAALRGVFKRLRVTPRVIASGDAAALGFAVDFRPWRLENELDELAQIGIGIAPLPDTPWERGKCGVKLLQYMACGIPVVASPVGVHPRIVSDGQNGFLAANDEQWVEYLGRLIGDAELRQRLGAAGREIVAQRYDVGTAAESVASVLRSVR
jgi:glycosyltransferase involved in cell wall biosynthesis